MFNKDYEVYRDGVAPENRWLFLNREGKGLFDPTGYIDLENYTRIDPNNKKKGQVLWKLKYNEKPHFQMGMSLGADSEDDGDDNPNVRNVTDMFKRMMQQTGENRFYSMKWRTFSEAKLKSVKTPGGSYSVKIKAKGYCTRQISVHYTKDPETGRQVRHQSVTDHEYVTKISYKVKTEDGTTIDRFDLFCCEDSDLKWECAAFTAELRGGWISKYPHEITTKPGIDPGFALLFAHVCVTEFAPDEIKKDLKPKWEQCPGYIPPSHF
jgi:hypothetical protein